MKREEGNLQRSNDENASYEACKNECPENNNELKDTECVDNGCCESEGAEESCTEKELEALKSQLEEKSAKCEEYMSALQRMAAEFDNYKKRTSKEKETQYVEAVAEVVSAFLPVADNMERALDASVKVGETGETGSLKDGILLMFRQLKDVMKGLNVEEIKSVGEKFDPILHNAVMHIEDEDAGENTVVEEFQKGYKIRDKVIRHSMVKVAN